MSDVRLLPMTDLGVKHGERGHYLDPEHPEACLCGEPWYLKCDAYILGKGLSDWTLSFASDDGDGWGQWGSADEHARYLVEAPNRRRKCRCGCGGRLTHYGMANGVALIGGCELTVRRWVRA